MAIATQADALRQPHAELALNGRCVIALEATTGGGTTMVYLWHAEGCEHVARQAVA
jgi:hypothetical protein